MPCSYTVSNCLPIAGGCLKKNSKVLAFKEGALFTIIYTLKFTLDVNCRDIQLPQILVESINLF